MKPHEETWEAYDTRVVVHVPEMTTGVVVAFYGMSGDTKTKVARARLAACAPEMARMLLEYEWVSDGNFASCGSCHGLRPEDAAFLRERGWKPGASGFTETTKLHEGHGPDCAWLALMRKAGVR